jgi:hypothetical protein
MNYSYKTFWENDISYKRCYIFVEGDNDVRFFENIIQPMLEEKYGKVDIIQYAQVKDIKIDNLIKSVKSMCKQNVADYIFITDIDNSPCITEKKDRIISSYKELESHKVTIVIKEIEGWYLAGIDPGTQKKFLKKKKLGNTDSICKEDFVNMLLKTDREINCRIEITRTFSIEKAMQNNTSFKYFCEKYLI